VPYINLGKLLHWQCPTNWQKFTAIDSHSEGEPLRIFTGGLPKLRGETILEKRKFFKNNYDNLRTSLMWEPRGHADMYGCIITEPERVDSDFGVIFTHNEGYSSMCGHGIIAVTKIAIETGLINPGFQETTIKIDAPAGQIISHAKMFENRVKSVYFYNVPSFVYLKDAQVEVVELGKVKFDIAYGGAFYAYVNADELSISMQPENYNQLIHSGRLIKRAVVKNFEIKHPFEEDLSFLYGTIFYGAPLGSESYTRNVCIFANGEVDRSPTGTGVSGRAAIEYAKGNLAINQPIIVESILGTKFSCKVIREQSFGGYNAVVPEVEGTANIIGKHEFLIDPQDTLKHGFIFR